jgi:hypothetical protein
MKELIDLDASEDDGPEQKEKDDNTEIIRRVSANFATSSTPHLHDSLSEAYSMRNFYV